MLLALSLLLPGSPDKGPLYLIMLPSSHILMVPSPRLDWGMRSSAASQQQASLGNALTGAAHSTEGMGKAGRLEASAGCVGQVPSTLPKPMDPTRAGATVPAPRPEQRAAAITACTGVFALLPINGATLSGGQGPEVDQSPLARQGY